jgi:hypothetical protein
LDVAVRELEISLAAFALAVLSEVREAAAELPEASSQLKAAERPAA